MEKLKKGVYPGLKTIYETPHVCGHCLGHIAWDWSFCPVCGTPTELTEEDAPGLKTTYETPHVCGHCLEHIAWDWSFCPVCGTPTELTEEDARAFTPPVPKPGTEFIAPFAPGDTVYDQYGNPWVVNVAELRKYGDKEKLCWLFRCGHPGTEDYCALYDWEIVSEADAPGARAKERERIEKIRAAAAASDWEEGLL